MNILKILLATVVIVGAGFLAMFLLWNLLMTVRDDLMGKNSFLTPEERAREHLFAHEYETE